MGIPTILLFSRTLTSNCTLEHKARMSGSVSSSSQISGSQLIAQSLKQLGVTHIFGIVGIPVIDVAEACISNGIKFISFRNEQAASYAAGLYGYLTGKPGVCLVVGGPGVIHAMAGVENATVNAFPLMLIAGSSHLYQRAKGAFQELDQVSLLKPHSKFAAQPSSPGDVPFLIEKAYRTAYFGRPGSTYVDLPADIIESKNSLAAKPHLKAAGPAPKIYGDPERIRHAAALLKSATSPLLIIGKGAAYGKAEKDIRNFETSVCGNTLAFLPTPMGKGVIPDSHPMNTSAARSAALKSADVILLLGARLNWILHFGEAPKFSPNVKIIQVDINAETLGDNAGSADLAIQGDIGAVVRQLSAEMTGWKAPGHSDLVTKSIERNTEKARKVETFNSMPIKYQPVYRVIRETLARSPRKIIYVSEGANTMDISRSSFPLESPRARLDAGTNATMGVGLGYAIAAKAANPSSLVVAIEGDSAFGFSAIEIETAVRSKLPVIIYVMNNSGVYHGADPKLYNGTLPSTALQLNTKYHLMAESLGAKGYLAETLEDVEVATIDAITHSYRTSVINVIIDSGKDKKLEFGWMASSKPKL